jgi:hypothetical protein
MVNGKLDGICGMDDGAKVVNVLLESILVGFGEPSTRADALFKTSTMVWAWTLLVCDRRAMLLGSRNLLNWPMRVWGGVCVDMAS